MIALALHCGIEENRDVMIKNCLVICYLFVVKTTVICFRFNFRKKNIYIYIFRVQSVYFTLCYQLPFCTKFRWLGLSLIFRHSLRIWFSLGRDDVIQKVEGEWDGERFFPWRTACKGTVDDYMYICIIIIVPSIIYLDFPSVIEYRRITFRLIFSTCCSDKRSEKDDWFGSSEASRDVLWWVDIEVPQSAELECVEGIENVVANHKMEARISAR